MKEGGGQIKTGTGHRISYQLRKVTALSRKARRDAELVEEKAERLAIEALSQKEEHNLTPKVEVKQEVMKEQTLTRKESDEAKGNVARPTEVGKLFPKEQCYSGTPREPIRRLYDDFRD